MKDFVAVALLSQLVDWIATCARLVDVAELELIFIYYCNNSAKVQTSLQFIYNIEPAIMLNNTIQKREKYFEQIQYYCILKVSPILGFS